MGWKGTLLWQVYGKRNPLCSYTLMHHATGLSIGILIRLLIILLVL